MSDKDDQINQDWLDLVKQEWRELGFYYDILETAQNTVWTFYGSKEGFKNLIKELKNYISNPINNQISEHEHYGPYHYLKIMTWNEPIITKDYIAGSIQDLAFLGKLIEEKMEIKTIGDNFTIDKEYGLNNTASALFTIMPDDFDPFTMDNNFKKF